MGLEILIMQLRIEWDSRRRNRRDLKKMEKMRRIEKMVVIVLSGHSWMPLGSIPGHPDASRSIPILVIGRGKISKITKM